MEEGIYIQVPGKVADFFSAIQSAGVPEKFTIEYLETLGFKSKNDRGLLTLLKFLGFVSSSGVPNQLYHDYRDKTVSSKVMAGAMMKAYSGLFAMYPDAYNKDSEALKNFFSSKMKVSEDAAQRMVSTFKALRSLADFNDPLDISDDSGNGTEFKTMDVGGKVKVAQMSAALQQPIVVNINIQLTLPETKDPDVYNNLFTALRKHVINQGNEAA